MTAPEVDALGFHVGLVSHDAVKSAEAYQRLLGGTFKIWETEKPAPSAIDPSFEDTSLRIAYGRYAGFTLEIIQVVSGYGHYAKWLEEHGESVQHIGFWVPDVREATRAALVQGARLRSASMSREFVATSEINELPVETVVEALLPGTVHLGYTSASVELEFVGPLTAEVLTRAFGDDLPDIMTPSPWTTGPQPGPE